MYLSRYHFASMLVVFFFRCNARTYLLVDIDLQSDFKRINETRALFSCPILDNQNHCASTVAHCSVSFVFVNYCPNID